MNKLNKSWMAVAAAALLLGTLVGVVWARPHDRPQAQDITRKVSLGASDFIPVHDGTDWWNDGDRIYCQSHDTPCHFLAPVVFPCLPGVTVERIKLHVKDDNDSTLARATLHRLYLHNGRRVWLGAAESPVGTGGYQPWSSDPINKPVWPSQRAYIWLSIGGTGIAVGGVTVEYHRNI
jgi:hypothetical protein